MEEVIDRIIEEREPAERRYSQVFAAGGDVHPEPEAGHDLGYVPAGDKYFLGKADFGKGVNLVSLSDTDSKGKKVFSGIGNFFSFAMQYLPDGFLQMIFIDTNGFDKQHYKFDYVKREFLGEVRCLVFDVTPLPKSGKGRFLGRIWVEDQDYHIVRFNGGYGGGGHSTYYFHFDSWRTNVAAGNVAAVVCVQRRKRTALRDDQEAGLPRADAAVGLQHRPSGAGTGIEQDSGGDAGDTTIRRRRTILTPIQAQRSWDREAEEQRCGSFAAARVDVAEG